MKKRRKKNSFVRRFNNSAFAKTIDKYPILAFPVVVVVGMLVFALIVFVGIGLDELIETPHEAAVATQVAEILSSDDPLKELIEEIEHGDDDVYETAISEMDESKIPFLVKLSSACDGEAVSSAENHYEELHPLVYLSSDGHSNDWTFIFLSEFGPPTLDVDDVQFVVCAEEETEEVIETCRYGGTSGVGVYRERIQYVIMVKIFEANTGDVKNELRVAGSEPRECPKGQLLLPGNPQIKGEKVTIDDLREQLKNIYD